MRRTRWRMRSSRTDEPGLDGLPETHIVCNREIHARQEQSLAKRLQLIRVDADARTVGRLKELRIGRRDRVPAQRVVVGAELAWIVEMSLRQLRPVRGADALCINFFFPENFQVLPFGVVFETGESDEGLVLRRGRGFHAFHEVSPRPHADDLALFGRNVEGGAHRGSRYSFNV